ncbi:SurA N-terminal domain-containing protein [Terrilactibacillus sp. S3-3]|nr:SurA N-terminal domain-containing protein [Terrilactibacillus sp. S3-3]
MDYVEETYRTIALTLGLSSLAACGTSNQAVVKTKAGDITQADFYKALKQDSSSSTVLQTLVYEKLLEQNYKVSDKEVNDKVKEYKKNYSSDAEFKAALAQNNMTESQFKKSVKDSLLMTKAQTAGVKITDKDMHNYYNKNKTKLIELKASHILVKDKKTADAVEKKLKNGGDFAKLPSNIPRIPAAKPKAENSAGSNKAAWCPSSARQQ